ncbi:MAG: hypothetical protein WC838_03435 [Candidatus Margulisiibacteriota bacterium]|jgi:hypothetical protein
MKCQHEHKTFLGVMDYRGYPEKLYMCDDCQIPISDFVSEEDLGKLEMDSAFVTAWQSDQTELIGNAERHLPNDII